jgi:hypothetical protein
MFLSIPKSVNFTVGYFDDVLAPVNVSCAERIV